MYGVKTKRLQAKQFILPGILLIFLAIEECLKRDSLLIEKIYSKGLYPVVIGGLNRVSSTFPFSLFEAVLYMLMLFITAGVGAVVWRWACGRRERVNWSAGALRLLSVVLAGGVLFNLLWGFNYYRLPLADQLGVTVTKHSSAELSSLCERLILDANALSSSVARDAHGVMLESGTGKDVLSRTAPGFLKASESMGLFTDRYGAPKRIWSSTAMSYAGIAGIYSPFTGEANVNGLVTAALFPATAMHEMAHVYGYSREDEANFIAWFTCRLHPDSDFRYSGAVLGLIYGMNALHDADPDEYNRLKAEYSPAVKADLEANREFWKRYEGPAEKMQDKLNDRYLKANGQKDGVASYGRMVDLLLEVTNGNFKISGSK